MNKILPAVLFASLLPLTAVADPGFYLGLKAGTVSVDEEEIDDLKNTPVKIDDSGMGAIVFGYRFHETVSLEIDIAGSEHDLENIPGYDSLDMGLVGMYVAWRTEGQWYGKLRGGLLSRNLEVNPTNPSNPFTPEEEDSDSSISIGFGGGVRVEQFQFEAEFTTVEEGVNTFGFSAIYNF